MRLFTFVLLFMMLAATGYAADEKHSANDKKSFFTVPDGIDTPENRGKFAAQMFDQACVKPMPEADGSEKFAQSFMTELTAEQDKAPFMRSVSATAAKVFYINVTGGTQPLNGNGHVYGGNAALVLEPNGKCHIISSGADADAMLSEMKNFAKAAREALVDQGITVTFKEGHSPQPNVKEAWVIFDFPNDNQLQINASGITPKSSEEISVMISAVYYGPRHGLKGKDLKP